jgi:hypothetical protein
VGGAGEAAHERDDLEVGGRRLGEVLDAGEERAAVADADAELVGVGDLAGEELRAGEAEGGEGQPSWWRSVTTWQKSRP